MLLLGWKPFGNQEQTTPFFRKFSEVINKLHLLGLISCVFMAFVCVQEAVHKKQYLVLYCPLYIL